MNIQKRETTSTYNMEGRVFEINSYDPMEGNYILSQILAFVLHVSLAATEEVQLKHPEETEAEEDDDGTCDDVHGGAVAA